MGTYSPGKLSVGLYTYTVGTYSPGKLSGGSIYVHGGHIFPGEAVGGSVYVHGGHIFPGEAVGGSVYVHGGHIFPGEAVGGVGDEHAGLADGAVSDHDALDRPSRRHDAQRLSVCLSAALSTHNTASGDVKQLICGEVVKWLLVCGAANGGKESSNSRTIKMDQQIDLYHASWLAWCLQCFC